MSTKADFTESESAVLEVAKEMSKGVRGCILVLDGGRPVGIITERDLVGKVLAEGVSPAKLRAKDIMTAPLVAGESETAVEEASQIMSQYSIRRLPVVKEGVLVGLITSTGIAMIMAKENKFEDHRLNALAKYCVSSATRPYG